MAEIRTEKKPIVKKATAQNANIREDRVTTPTVPSTSTYTGPNADNRQARTTAPVTPAPKVIDTAPDPAPKGPTNTAPAVPKSTGFYTDANGDTWQGFETGNPVLISKKAVDTTSRQNAFDLLKDQFTTYGVLKKDASGNYDSASSGLLKTINDLIMGGAGPDTASLMLQQSDAYKQRFAGNQTRLAAGLNVLSPAEYIATENAYDQVLKAAGVPAGFYSGTDEKAKLIGGDISAAELQDRVNVAAKSIANKDPFYSQTLQNYYGLTPGDMIAHALDPQAALPLLQRQQGAAQFGAAASRQGLSETTPVAEQYAALGVTQQQAEQGFQQIGTELPTFQKLAGMFGGDQNQQASLEAATFGGPNAAQEQLKAQRLKQQEINQFSGSAGVGKGSLQGDLGGTF